MLLSGLKAQTPDWDKWSRYERHDSVPYNKCKVTAGIISGFPTGIAGLNPAVWVLTREQREQASSEQLQGEIEVVVAYKHWCPSPLLTWGCQLCLEIKIQSTPVEDLEIVTHPVLWKSCEIQR